MAKKGRHSWYIMLIGGALLFVGYSMWYVLYHHRDVPAIVVVISPVFSASCTHDLNQYIDTILTFSAADIARLVKQRCAAVFQVRIAQRAGLRVVHVESAQLKCFLNDTHVFDEYGHAHAASLFDVESLVSLPVVSSPTVYAARDPLLGLFLCRVPAALLKLCQMTWVAPYEIYFAFHDMPYRVLGRFDHIPDERLFVQIARIYRHACQKMPKKKFDEMDVRFGGQIIVGSHTGG